jgi:hypothetical protein
MEMAVLNDVLVAENYYPDNDPNLEIQENVNWNLYVRNNMGQPQYVSILIKVSNTTANPPNSTTCTPTLLPEVYKISRILLDNETWIEPISWALLNYTTNDEDVILNQILINAERFELNIKARNQNDFRIIFELWLFNESSKYFEFSWEQNEEKHCAWNQIWFNIV